MSESVSPRSEKETAPLLSPEESEAFETLLDYLRRNRGFDFTGYKRASLVRRTLKRMEMVDCASFIEYIDYLEVHPDEFKQLFNVILINVTAFFRDLAAWNHIAAQTLPQILESKSLTAPLRFWSAGCASGEEACTLAILLAEAIGIEGVRERVKIYATDVDEEALSEARQAIYSAKQVAGVPPALLAKYFEPVGVSYQFHKELRRNIIFGKHDLAQDAPISRVDMLLCRNCLMYFNADMQSHILSRLHYALLPEGVLFLGKAEMLFTYATLFSPVELRLRLFQKVSRGDKRDRLLTLTPPSAEDLPLPTSNVRLRELVFDNGLHPQVVVDSAGLLILANERARTLFRLVPRDIGRPMQELEFAYRPTPLRPSLDKVFAERRAVVQKEVIWNDGRNEILLEVQFAPLVDNGNGIIGVSLLFTDVTAFLRLQNEVQQAHRELATAYEELQSTNEELETTNEELQSTVEELETTNEELQSTNEELETMNEELQSTNEELQTINDEVRLRSDQLNTTNAFLASILASLHQGVVVLDEELRVQVWNPQAEDQWGLRPEETTDKHFFNLDIGLPVEMLRPSIRATLLGETTRTEQVLEATNRRGRRFSCRVVITQLSNMAGEITGVILWMDAIG